MKKILSFICLIMTLNIVSCVDRTNPVEKPVVPEIENPFDFSTSKDVVLSVTYPLQFRTKVEIYTQNPISVNELKSYVKDTTIEPIAIGYTTEKGQFRVTLRMADMTDDIFVYSSSFGQPVILGAKINNATEIVLTQANSIEPTTKAQTRASKRYWENWAEQTFNFVANPKWSWKSNGLPEYLTEDIDVTEKMLEIIDATIPKDGQLDPRFCTLDDIAISEDAKVKIYFISHSTGQRKNSLAYYTYTDTKPTKEEINKISTVIFPNLHEPLKAGNGVELQYFDGNTWSSTFPAGVKIGFVLLVDAWAENAKDVASESLAVYSAHEYNRYDIPGLSQMSSRPHMAAFKADGRFILSFEDQPWNDSPKSPYHGDFVDDIFVLEANPETALPPVDGGVDPEVPDYGMEIKNHGIMAFEDLWPNKGDYDMNDVVVKYESSRFLSSDYSVVQTIIDEYTLLHAGAKFINGFGLEYGFTTSDIEKVDVSATDGVMTYAFDNHSLLKNATLMLFDDAVATPKGVTFKMHLTFKGKGCPAFTVGAAPYNPFITINAVSGEDTRREVHFVNYKPTPRVDMSKFGTGDDKSNPEKGIYYVSDAAYPFAIDIVDAKSYNVPKEGVAIDVEYPDFAKWVSSNGKEYKDWYKK